MLEGSWYLIKFLEQTTAQGKTLNIGPYRACMVKLYPEQERAFVAHHNRPFTRPTSDISSRFPYSHFTMQYIANKLYESEAFVAQLEHLQNQSPPTGVIARSAHMEHYLPDARKNLKAGHALLAMAKSQY